MKMARMKMMPGAAGAAGAGSVAGPDIMQMQATVARVDGQMSQLQSDMQTVLRLLRHEGSSPNTDRATPTRQAVSYSPFTSGIGQGQGSDDPLQA